MREQEKHINKNNEQHYKDSNKHVQVAGYYHKETNVLCAPR